MNRYCAPMMALVLPLTLAACGGATSAGPSGRAPVTAGQLPPPDWMIALDAIDENQRRVHIHAGTERGQMWLESWQPSPGQGADHAG